MAKILTQKDVVHDWVKQPGTCFYTNSQGFVRVANNMLYMIPDRNGEVHDEGITIKCIRPSWIPISPLESMPEIKKMLAGITK